MTQVNQTEFTLAAPDFSEALNFFTQRLGFRVEMIVPADAPHTAVLSGQGMSLRLTSASNPADTAHITDGNASFIVSHAQAENVWHTGRAGMQYRDLIPGRMGGRFIASHICIPDGGLVPDYVHYHKVRFQMIYCKAGWVRVVYEDQGEPFVMEAGDCVLQPPTIRHRVLEASAGLEVIEIGTPAIHETWADHELTLPTTQDLPERLFHAQRFVRHQARHLQWKAIEWPGFQARDTGIDAATNGLANVRVLRSTAPSNAQNLCHSRELLFYFVLEGKLAIHREPEEVILLQANDSCVIPAERVYGLTAEPGLEMLEVKLPYK